MRVGRERARRVPTRRLGAVRTPEPPAADAGSLMRTLRAVAVVGSPLAIGTVLLFYFGWVRTRVQALALGYDTTVLDMTTTDYVLKSVNVLFVPVVALLVVALGLSVAHHRLLARYDPQHPSRPWPPRWVAFVQQAWIVWPALGFVLFFGLPGLPEIRGPVLPLSITLAVSTYLYSRALVRHFEPQSADEPAVTRAILLALLVFALFWDTERVARVAGDLYAKDIAQQPEQLPAVTVYSKQRLLLDGPRVIEQAVGDPSSAYAYRYTGLYLLQRNADRYFLLAVDRTPETGRLIVLRDGDTTRIQLGA
jgi:hypothetical protein